jgi:hypothetical protein
MKADANKRPRYRYVWLVWLIFAVSGVVLLHFYPIGLGALERYVYVPLILLVAGHLGWRFGWGMHWRSPLTD